MTIPAIADSSLPAPAWQRLRKLLPWISLGTGIASALYMDRGPRRAALVASSAVALWVTLIVLHALARVNESAVGPRRQKLISFARRTSLLATQSLVQLSLFFAWPFYFQAASLRSWHVLFLLVLAALSLASLWDPFTEWLLTHPLLTPLMPAVGSFAGLDVVLPGLGFSTQRSLWIAAGTAVIGVAVLTAASSNAGQRMRRAGRALAIALLLPAALPLGLARIVPAAPLRLVRIEIGTRLLDRWVADPLERLTSAPEQLFCATAIWSPVGVKDKLFHVWRKDGAQRARVQLRISGGRAGGFRTYSRIEPSGREPPGTYRCSVETEAGQVLGSRSVRWMTSTSP
jgi:hypothetical protein